jgi:hypothetical protein
MHIESHQIRLQPTVNMHPRMFCCWKPHSDARISTFIIDNANLPVVVIVASPAVSHDPPFHIRWPEGHRDINTSLIHEFYDSPMFAGWKCHFGNQAKSCSCFVLPILLLCQNCLIDFPEYAGTGVTHANSSGCGSAPDIEHAKCDTGHGVRHTCNIVFMCRVG